MARPSDAGERISLMWIAANRDPAAFTDPEQVIVDRGTDDNLLFGAGIHRCLGESLAMLNVRVAVEELLRQIARFELAGAERATPKCLSEQRPARAATSVASDGDVQPMTPDAGRVDARRESGSRAQSMSSTCAGSRLGCVTSAHPSGTDIDR